MFKHKFLFLLICSALFAGCNNSKQEKQEANPTLEQEKWLFNTQYIRPINESSWEQFKLTALNNYESFKIDFTYISTGKPQTCGLYAKGVLVNNIIQGSITRNSKKFFLRPNVIPQSPIILTREYDSTMGDYVKLDISNMVDFIKACGDAHQYVVGNYNAKQ